MATTFGKITELVESQNGKVASHNEALDQLDLIACGVRNLDISAGGTFAVTEADSRYAYVKLTGTLAGNATITLDVDVMHPVVFVRDGDNGAFSCTIQGATGGTATDWETILMYPGDVKAAFFTGLVTDVDMGLVVTGTGNFFVKGGSVATGAYASSQVVHREVVAQRARFRATMLGSQAILAAAATAQTDFVVAVNGTDKGTIRFAIAGTVGTFVGNFSALWDVVPGDIVTVTAPASADATASGLAFTLKGHQR